MRTRAQYARLSRDLPPGHPTLTELRTRLKLERAEEYVGKLLAEAPPLTDEQRTRLAELLKPVRRTAGA